MRNNRIFRELNVLLQLRSPAGDPTQERVAADEGEGTENGSEG